MPKIGDWWQADPYDLDEGFYWVRLPDGSQQIALWDSERWWLCGDPRAHDARSFRATGNEQLQPPAAS